MNPRSAPLELLAPAGSPEALRAGVQAGADAVYLGYGAFNARRNAKNFSEEELAAAVSYCHLRGVKVYLTLNTLVSDRELRGAVDTARRGAELGVDAILVQDLGVAGLLRAALPGTALHASTQMTLHDLEGVRMAADLGMTRAVLSRELSRDDIAHICAHSPIEIEVFVHGALCMCYSGQCFFSSVIGGRSGNRGLCAQPCRLPYGWGEKKEGYPLSLKDMSLAAHLRELADMGVACAKIEGRMKRPEYVWVVTRVYAAALREGRDPTAEEMEQLRQAFSRQGFTSGYYEDRPGRDMFGVRQDTQPPQALFAQARAACQKETPRVGVTFTVEAAPGVPLAGTVSDGTYRAEVMGPVPEAARTRPLTAGEVEEQMAKTGGTPFRCDGVDARVAPGLSVPRAALNALRREALEELTALRTALPAVEYRPVSYPTRGRGGGEAPALVFSLRRWDQWSRRLMDFSPARVDLPLEELSARPADTRALVEAGVPLAAVLPRIAREGERPELAAQLRCVRQAGVDQALVGNLGLLAPAREAGFRLRGDFGLEVFNSCTLAELRRLGLESATASFELRLAQIRDLNKVLPTEVIVYGRLPLMITENCIHAVREGCRRDRGPCSKGVELVDRRGARFPVLRAPGCRSEIFNGDVLFLADRPEDYLRCGGAFARLLFTTEDAAACAAAAERYARPGRGDWTPQRPTRGLYYRDVE